MQPLVKKELTNLHVDEPGRETTGEKEGVRLGNFMTWKETKERRTHFLEPVINFV